MYCTVVVGVLELTAAEESGCMDFGRDANLNELASDLLSLTASDGVAFSFLRSKASLLFKAVFGTTRGDGWAIAGALRSEYTFGLGVILGCLSDFNEDDAMLSDGDLDLREDFALLLLERRPVLRKGKRSFMRDVGVSSMGCDELLSIESGRCLPTNDAGLGRGLSDRMGVSPVVFVVGVWAGDTSLKVSGCDSDFSNTIVVASKTWDFRSSNGPAALVVVGASSTCPSAELSSSSRRITVVSPCSVCEVRVALRRC